MCISFDGRELNYREVDRLTDELASCIDTACYRKPVAIAIAKSLEFYLAQIAVMKCGAFFIPIDPSYPQERIDQMLADSEAQLVLVAGKDGILNSHKGLKIFDVAAHIDLDNSHPADSNPTDHKAYKIPKLTATDNAYMIYTSGSTGVPKGVPIHHEAIINHNQWFIDDFNLTSKDRALQFTSVSFDVSIEEILPTYLAGASLHIAPQEALQSLPDFIEWVHREGITILNLPTAFWHELAHDLQSLEIPDSVRLVVIGGERVAEERVKQWFEQIGDRIPLYNAYGLTETTITSSAVKMSKDTAITIGAPVAGFEYQVWDKELNPLPAGEKGELVMAGVGTSLGYWNRPELTEKRFVTVEGKRFYRTGDHVLQNAQGNYEFLGRIDNQIKIRGHRIEPGEIEQVLNSHSAIGEAFVLPSDQTGSTELVGYYLPKKGSNIDTEVLADFLAEKLPPIMIPKFFVKLDSIPQTPGGKVDLNAFPKPNPASLNHEQGQPPHSATEKTLAQIWIEILDLREVHRDSDFFDYGGNSLKAMRLVSKISEQFGGLRIPIVTLAANSQLAALAVYIEQSQTGDNSSRKSSKTPIVSTLNPNSKSIPIVAIHGAGGGGLFFREFEAALNTRHPFHILESGLLYETGPFEFPKDWTIGQIAKEYTETIEDLIPNNQVVLAGYSLGGLLAYEIARLLNKKGVKIINLINIDAPNPATVTTSPPLKRIVKLCKLTLNPEVFVNKIRFRRRAKILDRKMDQTSYNSLDEELRSYALENHFNAIEEDYVPSSYDGSMKLIISEEGDFSTDAPNDYGWKDLVKGRLNRYNVPGDHLSMLEEPHLRHTLQAFRQTIEN